MNVKTTIDDDFASKRTIEAHHKRITKIAYAPSKRQKALVSKKAEKISGKDELLYKGEDLKRRPR
jgi:hypothetical protein